MFRILIVDDEPMTVEGLFDLLSNELSDRASIVKTDSSACALEMILTQRFDLVVTDIRMPEITGLNLARALEARWGETHLIFLTGYGEFDAVYEAIKYPNVSYLLKIEGQEKVVEAVVKHLRQIEEERRDEQLLERARAHLHAALPLLQRELIEKVLQGTVPDALGAQFTSLELPFDPDQPAVLFCARAPDAEGDASELISILHALLERFLPAERARVYLQGIVDSLMIWIVQSPGKDASGLESYIKGTLPMIQDAAAGLSPRDVSFVVGAPAPWGQLSDALARIRQLLASPMAAEQNLALSISDLPEGESSALTARRVDLTMGKLHLLTPDLEKNDAEGFMDNLSGLIIHALKSDWSPPNSHTVQLAVALFFSSYLAERTPELARPLWLDGLHLFRTLEEAKKAYFETAEAITQAQKKNLLNWREHTIDQVRSYIDAHPGEDLSLVQLADRFHFNPKYLSRLFKQKMGENLSDYINQSRLQTAIRLLADDAYKVQEVGRMVGFQSAPYFTRFFKRNLGVSPQSYRDKIHA